MESTASVVAWAIHEALERDLPAVEYPERTLSSGGVIPARSYRLDRVGGDVDVFAWVQSWSNTSLGLGGLAGQAFTDAVTVVVMDTAFSMTGAVYVGRGLRGLVDLREPGCMEAIAARDIIRGRYPKFMKKQEESK